MVPVKSLSFLLGFLLGSFSFLQAQNDHPSWQSVQEGIEVAGEQRIQPDAYSLYRIDFEWLKSELRKAPEENFQSGQEGLSFMVPMPDGTLQQFEVYMTWVLSEQDKDDYPDVRTFVGHGVDDPYAYARFDFTPHGFHGMILTHGNSYWIDPMVVGNTEYYMAYRKSDLRPRPDEDYTCHAIDPGLDLSLDMDARLTGGGLPTGPNLLVYDLAVTCTGEYGDYHGGTKPLAQAAIVTSINRITGLYERDMTIRLVLVPNNDTLVFADSLTDPFPCCNLGTSLGIGADLIDSLIGPANYDIGHTYCTYGGGGAANGVCESDKADGATGLTNPVGDPFDVDYVSHEMGHQFYAGHTFNYCTGQGHIPHEPGSGSTILAYAGLCGSANMQNYSIDAFSVGSYQQSVTYTQTGFGNSCATVVSTGNNSPSVVVPAGGFYIPLSTPFELTAVGNDVDGDSLTYSWEQWDFGPNVHPDSSQGNCPLFRVLWPTNDPQRIFPQIADLVNGTQTIGEQLPAYGREMTFRCAIRDNRGGSDYDEIQFQVADSAGPFQVLYPNSGVGFWTVGTIENITWDVANSDQFPVNCGAVDIYLSTDGGYSYPFLLATGRPNTGATAITVPNVTGNNMRIKIKGAGNHFFDISDSDFAIFPAGFPDYSLTVNDPVQTICGQDTAVYLIDLDTLGNFTDPVNLNLAGNPSGTGFTFSTNPANSPGTVVLSVWNGTASAGNYSMNLQGNSTSGVKNMPLTFRLRSGVVQAVSPISPFNGATNYTTTPAFSWNAAPFTISYRLQVATSPNFSAPILDIPNLYATSYNLTNPLNNNSVYYWRVQIDSADCGPGPWGPVYSFQTPVINCGLYNSTDVPVTLPSPTPDTSYSTLTIPNSLIITDVNVIDVEGDHSWMDDLSFFLNSPQGSRVHLYGPQCGDMDDFWFSFDDTSTTTTVPCPPTTGLTYQPIAALAGFNAENAQGTWVLEIIDRFGQDGGQLDRWALEICGPPFNPNPPTIANQLLSLDQGDTVTISGSQLLASCPDSNSTAIYTLVALPANGTLFLSGVALGVGDTFTQNDIDSGFLSYQHDNSTTTTDQFEFTLTCSNGGYVGGLTFQIGINLTVGVSFNEDVRLLIYPNPARERFQVRVEGIPSGDLGIEVYDILGKQVISQSGNGTEVIVPVDRLSKGLYTVRVKMDGESIGTGKLIKE